MTDKEYARMSFCIGTMKGLIDSLLSSQQISDNARRHIIDHMVNVVNPVIAELYQLPKPPVQLTPPSVRNIE